MVTTSPGYTQQGCKNGSSASDQGMMVRLGTDQEDMAPACASGHDPANLRATVSTLFDSRTLDPQPILPQNGRSQSGHNANFLADLQSIGKASLNFTIKESKMM
uniref:Uncharacterized protein n=1 Tax=Coccidioides posadasii RMSCC 3488 TaxID=454284 RepID=A0A0J6FM44_COCPO|nr:hypothetical protein CPAG_06811 [Coccidioides posadasii RMSCC 3488]